MMPDLTVTITDTQYKALRHYVISPERWLQSVIRHKARRCMSRAIEEVSDRNPRKISEVGKRQIIQDATLEPREE